MKRFLGYFILIVFTFLITSELICRIFNLSGDIAQEYNVDGDRLMKPNSEFTWTRGTFKQICSQVEINNIGFNCSRDFHQEKVSSKSNIAIIGDSFIEGYHVDTRNSLGKSLEQGLMDDYNVYEFGKAGGNLNDYRLIYRKYNLKQFDYVFIFVSPEDFFGQESSFMGKGDQIPNISMTRKLYKSVHFIRYLNYNHKIFQVGEDTQNTENETFHINMVSKENLEFMDQEIQNIVIVPRQELIASLSSFITSANYPIMNIEHTRTPIDFGFDVHWNQIGRLNAAESIVNYIMSLK